MPTYDYECENGHRYELVQSMKDDALTHCTQCDAKARRIIGPGAGFIFKGGGFYITDYRSKDYQQKAKSEASGGASDAGASGGSSSGGASGGTSGGAASGGSSSAPSPSTGSGSSPGSGSSSSSGSDKGKPSGGSSGGSSSS